MQLSSNARKAVAIGLAASTVLWAAGFAAMPLVASAQVHSDGCLVLSGGIVWMITNGTRRGFTSAEVFQSYGYNFGQVNQATAEDVALPVGPIMTYADGTLVMDPTVSPLVYLVTGGQKEGFVSGAVFTGLGFSFSNIQTAPANTFNDLPTGPNIQNATAAHGAGVLVISGGAIDQMTATGYMGFPSIDVFNSFGYNLSHVVAANAADLAMPNQGVVVARPACTGGNVTNNNPPVATGPVYVSLASDTPVSNTIVSGQSTADLVHLTFNGSGAVTQLTLARTGVSSNNLLTNVYLFNGGLRITDASSVNSSGQITFSNSAGLFTAPATISVQSDIQSGQSGQTVGISFVSGMSGTTAITGSASGNLMTVANPANLATMVFQANTAAGGSSATTNVNAGSLNYTIWSAPISVGNRAVWLKSLSLKGIGSASTDSIQNYILYVDGNQVGMTTGMTTINGSNYAVFNLATPASISTGSHTLEARADIIKGSARTMQFTLQQTADITATDSSYNVNITPNTTNSSIVFSANAAGTLSIQAGVVSVQLDPSFSAVSTVPGGATNVPLAKFTFTGYGEDVQINTLVVTFAGSAIGTNGLNNVALYANGAQVGSTQQIVTTGTTATFTLGSSLIIPAGGTTSVVVQADTIDGNNNNITSGTLQVSLAASGGNASNSQGRQSQSILSVPTGTVTAQQLTLGAGGLTVAKDAAYTNQTLSPNTTAQELGSFVLQAGTSEGIRISNLQIGLVRDTDHTTVLTNTGSSGNWPALTDLSNLKVAVNGGTPSAPQAAQASNNFSQNFTIPINGTATVSVWGDLGTTAAGEKFDTTLTPTATGVTSNVNAFTGSAVTGQAITLNAGSLSTPTFTTASSSASQFIAAAGGAADGSLNSFNLAATSGSVNVSELKFVVNGTAGSVSSVKVGTVYAPVITPAGTTLDASSGAMPNNGTAITGQLVTSTANMSVGTVFTVGSEDFQVTAVNSSTSINVTRGVDGTSNASHSNGATVTIKGMAYLTGLNLAVPNGSGGIYINALPTYANVGTTGNASGSTAQLSLVYTKFTAGSTTTPAAVTPVLANTMDLVASEPNLTATTTNNSGLVIGENHAFDLTITPNAKGNVQINTIVFAYSKTSGITTVSAARLAVGSTTITSSSCTVDSPISGDISCALPSGYVLTAGTPQTVSLYATITSSGGLGTSGTNSLTVSLGALDGTASHDFSWTDVAGTGVTFTTLNQTYFTNFPTNTWSITN